MEFLGTAEGESLQGTPGNDTIDGAAGNDILSGSSGNDVILGGEGDDIITGGDADANGDPILGTGGSDLLQGGAGDDGYGISLDGTAGTVILDEEGDVNFVGILAENTDRDILTASFGASNEEFAAVFGNPENWGDAAIELSLPQPGIVGLERSGNDLIIDTNRDGIVGVDTDLLIGNYFDEEGNLGAGAPFLLNNILDQQVVIDFFNANPSEPPAGAEEPEDINPDIELEFNPIIGTEASEFLEGTVANDSIEGGAGDDQLFGSEGDDIILGGAGNDGLSGGGNSESIVSLATIGGSDSLAGGEGEDIYFVSQTASGGTVVIDEEGDNGILVLAENSDLNTIFSPSVINSSDEDILDIFADRNLWGDGAVELASPQPGIIGLERSGTDLIVDINRDGIAEADNDLTIANYFDEAGNLGAGAPSFISNLTDPQSVVEVVGSAPQEGTEAPAGDNSDTTVYRFFNNDAGVHFYTADERERDAVLELDNFSFEGASYSGADPLTGDAVPVYRFLNEDTGVHLYTVSETEREVVQEQDNFSFEGEAFSAYDTEVEGSIPIYRFFNPTTGAHFYTPSATERDTIVSDLPDFQSEGVAYYALPSEAPPVDSL